MAKKNKAATFQGKPGEIIAQGDCPLMRLEDDFDLSKARTIKSGVLMEGETPGHLHEFKKSDLAEGKVVIFEVRDGEFDPRQLFARVLADDVEIVHPDHDPLPVAPGTWMVGQQVEADPEEFTRRVRD